MQSHGMSSRLIIIYARDVEIAFEARIRQVP